MRYASKARWIVVDVDTWWKTFILHIRLLHKPPMLDYPSATHYDTIQRELKALGRKDLEEEDSLTASDLEMEATRHIPGLDRRAYLSRLAPKRIAHLSTTPQLIYCKPSLLGMYQSFMFSCQK